jgi:hypothetical protein
VSTLLTADDAALNLSGVAALSFVFHRLSLAFRLEVLQPDFVSGDNIPQEFAAFNNRR